MSWPKMSLICNTVLYIVMQTGVLPICRIWNISMASIRILSKNMNFLLRLSRIMCITGLRFPMPMYSLKYRVIMCLWFILKTNRKIFCCKCVFRSMKTKFLVAPSVTSRTDIDYNREHQQVEVALNTNNYRVQNPYNELKISILQNSRRDKEVIINRPLRVQGNQIVFGHDRNMIFEAGNEFRRFEMVATRYAGLGVEKNILFRPILSRRVSYVCSQSANELSL